MNINVCKALDRFFATYYQPDPEMKKRHEQKLILITFGLFIAFNIPILLLFDSSQNLFGIPKVYVFIFLVWASSILLTFYITKRYNE